MCWEQRGERRYYTTTQRIQGRRKRTYFGAGRLGELAAATHEIALLEREESDRAFADDCNRWHALQRRLSALDQGAEMLSSARLLVAGFRRHRGEWRRPRNEPREQ